MYGHGHQIMICAGCLTHDLQLALSLLQQHNSSLEANAMTRRAEQAIEEITEVIKDATTLFEAERTSPAAGLG